MDQVRDPNLGSFWIRKTYWIQIHQRPTKYFLDSRTRLVDKYDQEELIQTRSHEEDSFDRLYSCLEKIMILGTIFKIYWNPGLPGPGVLSGPKWGEERSNCFKSFSFRPFNEGNEDLFVYFTNDLERIHLFGSLHGFLCLLPHIFFWYPAIIG